MTKNSQTYQFSSQFPFRLTNEALIALFTTQTNAMRRDHRKRKSFTQINVRSKINEMATFRSLLPGPSYVLIHTFGTHIYTHSHTELDFNLKCHIKIQL